MANELPEGVNPIGMRFEISTNDASAISFGTPEFRMYTFDPEDRQVWFNAVQAGATAMLDYIQTERPGWSAEGGEVTILGGWSEAVDTSPPDPS